MTVLQGKNSANITKCQLNGILDSYKKVCLDIGTGDGKNVYRQARNNFATFYLGMDPVANNMVEISKKISQKPSKGGIDNALFIIGTIENIPEELEGLADEIQIILPWGSLLDGVIKPVNNTLQKIAFAAKDNATFEFVMTYSKSFESAEIEKRQWPEMNMDYFLGEWKAILSQCGLYVMDAQKLDNDFIKSFPSLWAKKLAHGRKRDFYRIIGYIKRP